MKTFSSALMVTLAVVAMLWGNCLSCPQMMAGTAHSCCHKPHQPPAKCQTQELHHFVKADTNAPVTPVVLAIAEIPSTDLLAPGWVSAPAPILHTPPGSPHLITALRI